MMSLEDEISHLQKENSRIESQLSRWLGHHHYGGDDDVGGGDVGYDGDTEDNGDGMKRKEKERVLLRMKGDVSSTEGEVAADDRVFHFCHISPNLEKLRNHHLYLVLSPSIEPKSCRIKMSSSGRTLSWQTITRISEATSFQFLERKTTPTHI